MLFMWNVFSVHTEYNKSHGELWRVQSKYKRRLSQSYRGLAQPSVRTDTADVVPAVCMCNHIPGNTKGQTQGRWILSSVPTFECRQQRGDHAVGAEADWTLEWEEERERGWVTWEGSCCKLPEGAFLVSVGRVCGTHTGVQKPSRYPILLEKEMFSFEYLKQTLRDVYIHHFQGNLLNGLYISWAFKSEFMSSM